MRARAILSMIVAVAITGAAKADFPDDWKFRMPITINSAYIDSDLTDWTLVIDESFDPALTDEAGPLDADGNRAILDGGGDIRFSSDAAGTQRLAVDVRTASPQDDPTTGELELAVKIPSVSSSENTTIHMWWGKLATNQPAVDEPYGQYDAYDDSTEIVLTLNENPGDLAPQFKDRTSHQRHGTAVGLVAGDRVNGKLGHAIEFDNTAKYINLPDPYWPWLTATDPWSFSSAFRYDDNSAHHFLWSKYAPDTTYRGTGLNFNYLSGGKPALGLYETSGAEGDSIRITASSAFSSGTWGYAGASYDGSASASGLTLHTNGIEDATAVKTESGTLTTIDTPEDGRISGRAWGGGGLYWDGVIDEIRFSSAVRNEAWLKADYHNMLNTEGFLAFGAIVGDPIVFPDDWSFKMAITIDHGFVENDLENWTLVIDQSFDPVLISGLGPLDANGGRSILDGGGDIRFTAADQETRLPVDVRTASPQDDPTSGELELAVKVPLVSSSADTRIYMWWGQSYAWLPDPSDAFGQFEAYDSQYVLVNPSGGSEDRTSNGNTGTATGGAVNGDAAGTVGKGTTYDGTDNGFYQNVLIGDPVKDAWTIEWVVHSDDNGLIQLGQFDDSAGSTLWEFRQRTDSLVHTTRDDGESATIPYSAVHYPAMTFPAYGAYAKVAGANGNLRGYANDANPVDATYAPATPAYWDRFAIGGRIRKTPIEYNSMFKGVLDEVRVSDTNRSAAWLKANYHNMFDTPDFLNFGSVQDAQARGTLILLR